MSTQGTRAPCATRRSSFPHTSHTDGTPQSARERAPLPVPGIRPRVTPRYEPSDPAARKVLTVSGALNTDGHGNSSFDGGAHRPGPGQHPEILPTPLS